MSEQSELYNVLRDGMIMIKLDDWKELKQERDNLQTDLNEMVKSHSNSLEYINKLLIKNDNLKAANGVLRKTLQNIKDSCIDDSNQSGESFRLNKYIESILSITPEQAGERVQGLLNIATNALSYIAYCSNAVPGDCHTLFEHQARWLEKSRKAKSALQEMENLNDGSFRLITGTGANHRRNMGEELGEKTME